MNLQIWQGVGSISLLTAGAVWDIRTRKIPYYLLAAGMLPAVLFLCLRTGQSSLVSVTGKVTEVLFCFLPGLFLLLLSLITDKKVGMGDGLMLLILGGMEGGRIAGLTFCCGLFLQSLFAVAVLVLRKANKQTALPFVPFLLLGRILIFLK